MRNFSLSTWRVEKQSVSAGYESAVAVASAAWVAQKDPTSTEFSSMLLPTCQRFRFIPHSLKSWVLMERTLHLFGENHVRKTCFKKTLSNMTLHGCTTSLLVLPCNRHPQLRRPEIWGHDAKTCNQTHQFLSTVHRVSVASLTRWSRCRPKQPRKKEQKHHMYHPSLFEIHPTPYFVS